MVYGSFQLLDEEHPTVFAYERKSQRKRLIVILNWSSQTVHWEGLCNAKSVFEHGILLQTNYSRARISVANGAIKLSPWEAIVAFEDSSLL